MLCLRQTCTLPEDSCFSVFRDFYIFCSTINERFCSTIKQHTHIPSNKLGFFKNRTDSWMLIVINFGTNRFFFQWEVVYFGYSRMENTNFSIINELTR